MTNKKIALFSYPRSGNTWVRYLLKYYTGITPGSVYARGQHKDYNKAVFIKTHELNLRSFKKIIHLVRNPVDCIPSFWKWNCSFTKRSPVLEKELPGYIKRWTKHIEYINNINKPKLLIRYEDLIENTGLQLQRIISFSDLDHDEEKVKKAVDLSSFDRLRSNLAKEERIEWEEDPTKFFDTGQVGKGRTTLSEEQREQIVSKLRHPMKELGYLNTLGLY